jgi:hypothetical protein
VEIEIHLSSDSPSYQRGRELARQFLHSANPDDLAKLCREMVAEVLEKEDASILASVVYNLAMVAFGLRRAVELEEDPDFAEDIVEGLWAALSESPVPPDKADLTLGSIGPRPEGAGRSESRPGPVEADSAGAMLPGTTAAEPPNPRPPEELQPPVRSQASAPPVVQ